MSRTALVIITLTTTIAAGTGEVSHAGEAGGTVPPAAPGEVREEGDR